MKRYFILLLLSLMVGGGATYALPINEARRQALFLTDKMAYELNLTFEQYDNVYQINFDYCLNVNSPADLYGYYWRFRSEDLRYVLFSWQYAIYAKTEYFLRPIQWIRSSWYYPIYTRYKRDLFFFDRPRVYVSYNGGFWRRGHNGLSPYHNMCFHQSKGMRERIDRNWNLNLYNKDKRYDRIYDRSRYDSRKNNYRNYGRKNHFDFETNRRNDKSNESSFENKRNDRNYNHNGTFNSRRDRSRFSNNGSFKNRPTAPSETSTLRSKNTKRDKGSNGSNRRFGR